MNYADIKKRFGNKTKYYLAIVATISGMILFVATTSMITGRVEKAVKAKKAELSAFHGLRHRYLKEYADIEPLEKRLFLPLSKESPVAVIEELCTQIGIHTNITSLNPTEDKPVKGYLQYGIEVKLDGVTFNQMANLLYRVENYKNLLLIKDFQVKSHFDNPDLCDITVQLFLVTKQHE